MITVPGKGDVSFLHLNHLMSREAGVHLKEEDWGSPLSQVLKVFINYAVVNSKFTKREESPRLNSVTLLSSFLFLLFADFPFFFLDGFFLSWRASVVLKCKRLRGMPGGVSQEEKPTRRVK